VQPHGIAVDTSIFEIDRFPKPVASALLAACPSQRSHVSEIARHAVTIRDSADRIPVLETVAHWPHKSQPSFKNYVERCVRSPPETIESGRGHNLPNARLARLRAQAQSDFLRS
jgi:hypothetical protein